MVQYTKPILLINLRINLKGIRITYNSGLQQAFSALCDKTKDLAEIKKNIYSSFCIKQNFISIDLLCIDMYNGMSHIQRSFLGTWLNVVRFLENMLTRSLFH